jgi:hypothetical protein
VLRAAGWRETSDGRIEVRVERRGRIRRIAIAGDGSEELLSDDRRSLGRKLGDGLGITGIVVFVAGWVDGFAGGGGRAAVLMGIGVGGALVGAAVASVGERRDDDGTTWSQPIRLDVWVPATPEQLAAVIAAAQTNVGVVSVRAVHGTMLEVKTGRRRIVADMRGNEITVHEIGRRRWLSVVEPIGAVVGLFATVGGLGLLGRALTSVIGPRHLAVLIWAALMFGIPCAIGLGFQRRARAAGWHSVRTIEPEAD